VRSKGPVCKALERELLREAAAGRGGEAVHGSPGAVHVHEGDCLIVSGPATGLADRPGAGGQPQGLGVQQAGQAQVVRGARAAARATAEAKTHQLVGAVAQAKRAHRHQLRAQAAAPRPRGPRAAVPALRPRRAAPSGRSGRGLRCGPGRRW
jgi:hypothetical protein